MPEFPIREIAVPAKGIFHEDGPVAKASRSNGFGAKDIQDGLW